LREEGEVADGKVEWRGMSEREFVEVQVYKVKEHLIREV